MVHDLAFQSESDYKKSLAVAAAGPIGVPIGIMLAKAGKDFALKQAGPLYDAYAEGNEDYWERIKKRPATGYPFPFNYVAKAVKREAAIQVANSQLEPETKLAGAALNIQNNGLINGLTNIIRDHWAEIVVRYPSVIREIYRHPRSAMLLLATGIVNTPTFQEGIRSLINGYYQWYGRVLARGNGVPHLGYTYEP
jgi:hypothetical protein